MRDYYFLFWDGLVLSHSGHWVEIFEDVKLFKSEQAAMIHAQGLLLREPCDVLTLKVGITGHAGTYRPKVRRAAA